MNARHQERPEHEIARFLRQVRWLAVADPASLNLTRT